MKHVLASALILLGFGGAIASQGLSVAFAAGPHAALLEFDDTIQSVSARFVSRAIDTATEDGAQLLIVELDTPGGLYSSTEDMVEDILASGIPIVVYVSPSGAHAASAGTFVTAAAHVAAMAPATTIGAASPVPGSGENLPATIGRKPAQDAAALMREIARARGRNVEALEQTVLNAKAYSASEALAKDVVDLVAKDIDDLMGQLDGMEVLLKPTVTDGTARGEGFTLRTEGLEIRQISQTPVERFLGFLADPNVAFVLLTLGALGIFVEFLVPGTLVPGIAGVIALALAFVALGNLPVNLAGVGLLALAMVLLFIEIQAPGIGVFGIAGVISFVLGAFLLFGGFTPPPIETPSFKVNIWLILGVATAMLAVLLFLVRDLVAARRAGAKGATTQESLVGQIAIVTSGLAPQGMVHVGGEDWSAVSDAGQTIGEGEEVMVLEAEGLTLRVFRSPLSDQSDEGNLGEEPA